MTLHGVGADLNGAPRDKNQKGSSYCACPSVLFKAQIAVYGRK